MSKDKIEIFAQPRNLSIMKMEVDVYVPDDVLVIRANNLMFALCLTTGEHHTSSIDRLTDIGKELFLRRENETQPRQTDQSPAEADGQES